MAASDLREYFAIIHDFPNSLDKRVKVRAKHLERVLELGKEGVLRNGTAFATDFPEEGQTPPFEGSILIVRAKSKQDVLDLIKADIYYTEGVWDVDNAKIYAAFTAVRNPL